MRLISPCNLPEGPARSPAAEVRLPRLPRPRRHRAETRRVRRPKHLLMCPPTFFPASAGDPAVAQAQWDGLRGALLGLGHRVSLIPSRPGLPHMVFAGRAATVVDGRVLGGRFRRSDQLSQSPEYLRWFADRGHRSRLEPVFAHEGGADLLAAGPWLIGACGPQTERLAHAEAGGFLGRPVVPVELVDPRFPALSSALTVLADGVAAYHPGAFSAAGRVTLVRLFPELIEVDEQEALALGLDAVSDGLNVVLPDGAPRFAAELLRRGFRTATLEMSAFVPLGGGVRSCVLELSDAR